MYLVGLHIYYLLNLLIFDLWMIRAKIFSVACKYTTQFQNNLTASCSHLHITKVMPTLSTTVTVTAVLHTENLPRDGASLVSDRAEDLAP